MSLTLPAGPAGEVSIRVSLRDALLNQPTGAGEVSIRVRLRDALLNQPTGHR
jgi:hypothetical protein